MRRWTIGFGVMLSACSPAPIVLELPDLGGAPSAIVAVERSTRQSRFEIIELLALSAGEARAPAAITDYSADDQVRLTVIAYPEPLSRIGLEAGPIEAAVDGTPLLDLAGGATARQMLITKGEASDWEVIRLVPEPLSAVKLRVADVGCVRFRPVSTPWSEFDDPSFVLAMNDSEVYVGLQHSAKLLVVHREGRIRDVTPPPEFLPQGSAAFPTWGGFRESERVVWFGGAAGNLWRVRVADDLTPIEILTRTSTTRTAQFRWVTGDSDSSGVEVFAKSVEGALFRFDGQSLQLIHQFEYDPAADWRGGLARVARGEVVATSNLSNDVVRYKNGQKTIEHPVIDARTGFPGIGFVPAVGLLVSDAQGGIFLHDGAGWSEYGTTTSRLGPDIFVPYQAGFIFGGAAGQVFQWRFQGALCPSQPQFSSQNIRFLGVIGDAVVATGPVHGGEIKLPITVLEPIR